MLRNYRLMFFLFVVCAAIAAIIAVVTLNRASGLAQAAVAAANISEDEVASSRNVGTAKIPQAAVQSDTAASPADLQGMAARGFIPAGTVLRRSMFQKISASGAEAKLSLEPGLVAVALPVGLDTTVGGEVRAGCRVDVAAVKKDGSMVAVASGVEVLSVPDTSSQNQNSLKGVVLGMQKGAADQLLALEKASGSSIVMELLPPPVGGGQT